MSAHRALPSPTSGKEQAARIGPAVGWRQGSGSRSVLQAPLRDRYPPGHSRGHQEGCAMLPALQEWPPKLLSC